MLDSRSESVFNFSMVAGSIFANAASVGANTVNSLPLSVSTRFTFGFSLPDTAAARVVNSGLFDAATATGSCAVPVTEPGPVGFWAAQSAQPAPTRLAPGSSGWSIGFGAALVAAMVELAGCAVAEVEAPSEHADRPRIAIADTAATEIALR